MKCALEIIETTEVAKEIIRKEEEAKDLACMLKHQEVIENSIRFCEEVVGQFFEANASKGIITNYIIEGRTHEDRLKHRLWSPLKYDGQNYADGTRSRITDYSIEYDINTIISYLKQFCYEVELIDFWYKTYGLGATGGTSIQVKIDTPKCLN